MTVVTQGPTNFGVKGDEPLHRCAVHALVELGCRAIKNEQLEVEGSGDQEGMEAVIVERGECPRQHDEDLTVRYAIERYRLDHFRQSTTRREAVEVRPETSEEFDVLDLANDVKISAGIGQEDVNVGQRFETRAKFGGALAHATGERF